MKFKSIPSISILSLGALAIVGLASCGKNDKRGMTSAQNTVLPQRGTVENDCSIPIANTTLNTATISRRCRKTVASRSRRCVG